MRKFQINALGQMQAMTDQSYRYGLDDQGDPFWSSTRHRCPVSGLDRFLCIVEANRRPPWYTLRKEAGSDHKAGKEG
jgi:hypothetical protein